MKVTETTLPGVLILEPRVMRDPRGFFLESYNEKTMAEAGIHERFVQDNHSFSTRNVVRGLHYQVRPQGKLVRVVAGEILDVTVDLRRSGFAHGFRVLSDGAHVLYKATDFYDPEAERTIAWNDPTLNIDWRLTTSPTVSVKDSLGTAFREAEVFA